MIYTQKSCSFYDIEKTLIPWVLNYLILLTLAKNPMNGRTDWADLIYFKKKLKKSEKRC